MTTISTPVPTGTKHLRMALLATFATLVATAMAVSIWALVDSRTGDSSPVDPVTVDASISTPQASELTLAEEIRMIREGSSGTAVEPSVTEPTLAEEIRMIREGSGGTALD